MTANKLSDMINHGKGKEALDEMIREGLSAKEIYKLYDTINFYPNSETDVYIEKGVRRRKSEKAALKELNSFFNFN